MHSSWECDSSIAVRSDITPLELNKSNLRFPYTHRYNILIPSGERDRGSKTAVMAQQALRSCLLLWHLGRCGGELHGCITTFVWQYQHKKHHKYTPYMVLYRIYKYTVRDMHIKKHKVYIICSDTSCAVWSSGCKGAATSAIHDCYWCLDVDLQLMMLNIIVVLHILKIYVMWRLLPSFDV